MVQQNHILTTIWLALITARRWPPDFTRRCFIPRTWKLILPVNRIASLQREKHKQGRIVMMMGYLLQMMPREEQPLTLRPFNESGDEDELDGVHYVTLTLENGMTLEVLERKPGEKEKPRLMLIYNSDIGGKFEALAEFFTPCTRAFEKRFEISFTLTSIPGGDNDDEFSDL